MESTITMLARNLLTTAFSALSSDPIHDADAIRKELQMMLAYLSDAEHLWMENSQKLATLADEARELAYDAEDSIDELMLYTERDRVGGYFERPKYLLRKPETHLRVTKQLRTLSALVRDLRSKVESFDLADSSNSSNKPVVEADPAVHAYASTLVGMDGPRSELVMLLTEEEDPELASRLKVVSIVGLGGMGKTTLAAEVYKATQAHFNCRAWVLMSPRSDLRKIFINILHQVEDPHSKGSHGFSDELPILIRKIRQSLENKRYLLVLDDIWSSETWEVIKSAFPFNSLGSRIITTTRSSQVASSCCSQWNDHIYHIRPLSLQDSRMLFHKRVFGSLDHCPSELEDVSHRIMNKCSGLPLALTVVSGFLANKPRTPSIWGSVYDSIASAPESTGSIIRDMLTLSYDTLPNHLKMCCLYLSIFPEDYVLNYDSIVRGWIAEGLIRTDSSTSLQAKAEIYLNELITRNMIQPVHGSDECRPGAFKIHPLMLDLIRHKSSEQNFVTSVYNKEPVSVSYRKIRRISIISGIEGHGILASVDISHIRSLYIFGGGMPKLPLKHLTLLRVLTLNGCKGLKDHDIEDIAGLLLLRYLSIRETPISKLPGKIGRLQYLVTLDLRGTNVQELPSSFVKLQRLEHLLCDKMIFPVGIVKMAALRELVFSWFPAEKSRYETIITSLHKLKLQSLSVHGDGSSMDFFNDLNNPLPQLERIQLSGSSYLIWKPVLTTLLPSLTHLSIDIMEIKNEDIQLLSRLPSLIHLFVSTKVVPKEKIIIRTNGFQALKEFQLHSVRADLKFEPQAMEELETLLLSLHVLPEETYDFSISIDQFMCFKKIDIRIHGEGAAALAKATDAAMRKAAAKHVNHPVVNIVAHENLNDYEVQEGKEKECKFHPSGSLPVHRIIHSD